MLKIEALIAQEDVYREYMHVTKFPVEIALTLWGATVGLARMSKAVDGKIPVEFLLLHTRNSGELTMGEMERPRVTVTLLMRPVGDAIDPRIDADAVMAVLNDHTAPIRAQRDEAVSLLRDCLRHLDFEAGNDDQYATGARKGTRIETSPSGGGVIK